jgi:hypothetical protein
LIAFTLKRLPSGADPRHRCGNPSAAESLWIMENRGGLEQCFKILTAPA